MDEVTGWVSENEMFPFWGELCNRERSYRASPGFRWLLYITIKFIWTSWKIDKPICNVKVTFAVDTYFSKLDEFWFCTTLNIIYTRQRKGGWGNGGTIFWISKFGFWFLHIFVSSDAGSSILIIPRPPPPPPHNGHISLRKRLYSNCFSKSVLFCFQNALCKFTNPFHHLCAS